MKLRQKSKRDQALDAVASIAKTWSEWHLGERISKTATKASRKASKKARKAQLPDTAKRGKLKIAGAVAVLGGVGAAVAKKLRGGKAEPIYTPPGPAADMESPPPSPVVVEDLTQGPPPPDMPPVPPTVEPALTASKETPEPEPTAVVVDDLAGATPDEEAPDGEEETLGSAGSGSGATASSSDDDAEPETTDAEAGASTADADEAVDRKR